MLFYSQRNLKGNDLICKISEYNKLNHATFQLPFSEQSLHFIITVTLNFFINFHTIYQVIIAQWLARQLATGETPGSNPGKGVNY